MPFKGQRSALDCSTIEEEEEDEEEVSVKILPVPQSCLIKLCI